MVAVLTSCPVVERVMFLQPLDVTLSPALSRLVPLSEMTAVEPYWVAATDELLIVDAGGVESPPPQAESAPSARIASVALPNMRAAAPPWRSLDMVGGAVEKR